MYLADIFLSRKAYSRREGGGGFLYSSAGERCDQVRFIMEGRKYLPYRHRIC